jgi:hypothetical protein
MSDATCIVCGRPGAVPVVRICVRCLQFAGNTFSTLTEVVRSGRVPADQFDWPGLVETASLAVSRTGDLADQSKESEQVADIVANASRLAGALDTVYEEIGTASKGGQPDLDRVAGAIDDGIGVLFGNDATSLIVQAGVRASLDMLAGDQPPEVLKDVLHQVLPGWMLTDLWIDQVFPAEEPKGAVAPESGEHEAKAAARQTEREARPAAAQMAEHEYEPRRHEWDTLPRVKEGRWVCRGCGLDAGTTMFGHLNERCPKMPDGCSRCGRPEADHPSYLGDLSADIDQLGARFAERFHSAGADESTLLSAVNDFFDGMTDRLRSAGEEEGSAWLTSKGPVTLGAVWEEIQCSVWYYDPAGGMRRRGDVAFDHALDEVQARWGTLKAVGKDAAADR